MRPSGRQLRSARRQTRPGAGGPEDRRWVGNRYQAWARSTGRDSGMMGTDTGPGPRTGRASTYRDRHRRAAQPTSGTTATRARTADQTVAERRNTSGDGQPWGITTSAPSLTTGQVSTSLRPDRDRSGRNTDTQASGPCVGQQTVRAVANQRRSAISRFHPDNRKPCRLYRCVCGSCRVARLEAVGRAGGSVSRPENLTDQTLRDPFFDVGSRLPTRTEVGRCRLIDTGCAPSPGPGLSISCDGSGADHGSDGGGAALPPGSGRCTGAEDIQAGPACPALWVVDDARPAVRAATRSGEAVRIMTGSPVPLGADAVLPAESAAEAGGR